MSHYEPRPIAIVGAWTPPPGELIDGKPFHKIALRNDAVFNVYADKDVWVIARPFIGFHYLHTDFKFWDDRFHEKGYTTVFPPPQPLC